MLAFYYFPQCLFICCTQFIQLYLESILLLQLKAKSFWHFLLISILAGFSLLTAIFHISCVFIERILLGALIRPKPNPMVYIIGAPRSGTTRMHKLLAADQTQFTAMRMWELFFAPALIQKKLFRLFGKIDELFNCIFSKSIQIAEKKMFSKFNTIHSLSLFNVEEDALILFQLFYSYHLSFMLGKEQSYSKLNRNKNIPKAVWVYYKYCIENHQKQNPTKIYLSKNPFFTAHTTSLEELFPNIKFINMNRKIEEVAPSFFSMKKHLSFVFYGCEPTQKKYQEILELLLYWQKRGAEISSKNSIQIDYLDLKNKPSNPVERIYTFLDLPFTISLQNRLKKENEQSKHYTSKHKYKHGDFLKN